MNYANIAITLMSVCLSVGIAWGIFQQKIKTLESEIEEIKKSDIAEVKERIGNLEKDNRQNSEILARIDERTKRTNETLDLLLKKSSKK
jgi:hypothetical protein